MEKKTTARNGSEMPDISFEGPIERIGDRDILRFPDDASALLPSRGQVSVQASIDGHAVDTVIEPDGMRGHWLPIDQLWPALAAGYGDSVKLEVVPVKAWPEPDIPEDLRIALDAASDITEVWNDITPMARWEWVRWVNATKNPQTRQRRVEVSISKLRSGKRRPCCFNLASCTDPDLSKNGKLIDAT